MDEITQIKRENGRLKMQLELLKQKLYQVCLSHDYIAGKFLGLGLPMTKNDSAMMEATSRIVKATSTEEVETIYNEMSRQLWKDKFGANPGLKPNKTDHVQKIFFFGDANEQTGLHQTIMDAIQNMINDIDKQIKSMESQDKGFSIDDSDEPEDPLDKTDDLKPPF